MPMIIVGLVCLTYCGRGMTGDHKWASSRACYLAWFKKKKLGLMPQYDVPGILVVCHYL